MRFLVFVIVLALLIGGGWWAYSAYAKSEQDLKQQQKAKAGPPPVPIQATATIKKDMPIFLDGLGTVQGYYTVTVRTQVDGELREVLFTEGQDVHKGDVLARIDPDTYKAQVAQANAKTRTDESNLKNALLNKQRYDEAEKAGAATKQNVTDAQTVVEQLQATVKADDANTKYYETLLNYCTIRAPIDGRTGLRYVDVGNIVHASDANGIVVITQIEPISVFFTLPQRDLPAVMDRQKLDKLVVLAMSNSGKKELGRGTLELIDNQIDPTTGTMRMKAKFANQDRHLWPGGFVNVRLLLETKKDALVVPETAIQDGPSGQFVFIVKADQTVDMRTVTVSRTQDGLAMIDKGLEAGDVAVLTGHDRLKVGTKVAVSKSKPEDLAAAPAPAKPGEATPTAPAAPTDPVVPPTTAGGTEKATLPATTARVEGPAK